MKRGQTPSCVRIGTVDKLMRKKQILVRGRVPTRLSGAPECKITWSFQPKSKRANDQKRQEISDGARNLRIKNLFKQVNIAGFQCHANQNRSK